MYFSATNEPLSKDAADQRTGGAGQLPNLWITVAIILLIIVLILILILTLGLGQILLNRIWVGVPPHKLNRNCITLFWTKIGVFRYEHTILALVDGNFKGHICKGGGVEV